MIIHSQNLGLTIDDIREMQRRNLDPYIDYFKWRSEYLPFILAAGGILGIVLVRKMKKKKKRGKK